MTRLRALETLPIAALTVAGVVLRIAIARQSAFGDEISTYWISATHSLGGVLSLMYGTGRITHAEITPPLYFLAAWLTSQTSHTIELVRLPSLIAGTLTIPLGYVLGRRLLARGAALIGCALISVSTFMIYYSGEARAYAMMMLLVMLSTLAMLLALDTGRARWWIVYAIAACAAFYTHYTCIFVLLAQLGWLLLTHPQARRTSVLASAGAAVGVVAWIPGLINNLHSPTVTILSDLAAFTPESVRVNVVHWAIGYPYAFAGGVDSLPGVPALVLLGLAALLTAIGLSAKTIASRRLPALGGHAGLLFALAAASAVGEALVSAAGNHVFGARNLAASWPYAAMLAALLLTASGRRLGAAAAALAVLAFALGAAREVEPRFQRPDYKAAAQYLTAHANPGDVIIDGTGTVDPGPLTPLDISLRTRLPVIRAQAPAERDHPFSNFDAVVPLWQAMRQGALAAASGGRLFVVLTAYKGISGSLAAQIASGLPPVVRGYTLAQSVRYPGIATVEVGIYSRRA